MARPVYEYNTKDERRHLYQSTFFTSQTSANFGYRTQLGHLAFLAKKASTTSTSFVGQCSRWHCSKRSASSRSSVMVKRIDVSVRYNLEKTRSVLGHRYDQRSDDQHSAVGIDVWKLDTATTAECCRSVVRGLFCCSRCPLLTPENILCLLYTSDAADE